MSVLKRDHVIKHYFLNKERFADMMNVLCFHGKHIVTTQSLSEYSSDETMVIDELISIERRRDIIMKAQYQGLYILMAIEGQSDVDYTMVTRCLLYDALGFALQDQKKKDFYLMPIMSVVLYYGERQWNGATCLLDRIQGTKEIKACHNDWKIHVVDMKNIDSRLFSNQDNRQLVQGLQSIYQKDIAQLKKLCFHQELALTLALLVGKEEMIDQLRKEKGDVRMYSLFQDFENIGLKKGRQDGILFTLVQLLNQKLGHLSQDVEIKIRQSEDWQLNDLTQHIFEIESEEDILQILSKKSKKT